MQRRSERAKDIVGCSGHQGERGRLTGRRAEEKQKGGKRGWEDSVRDEGWKTE